MKVQIKRDQAVWERETFEIEVPDELYEAVQAQDAHASTDADDALSDAIRDAIYAFDGYCDDDRYSKEILDEAVMIISTETVATLPDDTEIEL